MAAADCMILDGMSSIFSVEGKVALVTGGSRGLGLHAASGLLQAGCSKVYITSRSKSACEAAAATLNEMPSKPPGAQAIAIPANCAVGEEISRLVDTLHDSTDHVDILFANAGTAWIEKLDTHSEERFSEVMDTNVKGVFLTVQKLIPLLTSKATKDGPSRVIINASMLGLQLGPVGDQGTWAYSASKAAVIHLARNLAMELGPRMVLVNTIAPGFYPSEMAAPMIESLGADNLASMSPNGRLGRPEDIAGLVIFLSSRAASHINGSVITTDGGASLRSL